MFFRTSRRRIQAGFISLLLAGFCVCLSAFEKEAIAITDSLGRSVILPERAGRVLSLQPEITRIVIALGAGQRLVGADYFILKNDHIFPIIYPDGQNLPAVSNTPEDMNFEMALKLNPDVIFVSPTELQMAESLQKKIRRPVVALASMGRLENLMNEIGLVGRLLGREERAEDLRGYFKSRIDAVRHAVASVADEQKPRVYISFWRSLTRTPIAYEPVDVAGGVNCAGTLLPASLGTISTVVQIEQILLWAPDIVLLQGNYPPRERTPTVNEILKDKRLGSVPAIMNGRVYYAFGFWYWWDPAEVLVETVYLAHLFHPDKMGPFNLEREGNAVFEKFYGVEGGFSSLCRILGCGEWHEN